MSKQKAKPKLAEFARVFQSSPGPQCWTCRSPHAAEINAAAKAGTVRPTAIVAWLRELGDPLPRSSVERHLRERHHEKPVRA